MKEKSQLELYIHIPFCVQKCAYCDFLSAPSRSEERQRYLEGLLKEIYSYREIAVQYEVTTIFLGGGTPSILEAEQTGQIFAALTDVFSIRSDAEVTTEVNPGTVTREKLEMYRRAGINRLSIGVQSVNDAELRNLGRIHTYRMFLETYRTARETGFENVNVDLISAIPGQSKASWQHTLHTILALQPQPEHISAYSLIIEEGTPFYELYEAGRRQKANCPLPDEAEERAIYHETVSCLKQAGYARYEISNYAKDGCECRHNLGYWERREYLGLGLGASSLLNNQRFSNASDMEEYLTAPGKVRERQELSGQEQIEEFMFLGLRKMQGVGKQEFCDLFGCNIEDLYAQELTDLFQKELLIEQDDYIRLTERGIDVSNYVFAEFLRL